jgi:hypothetical protein
MAPLLLLGLASLAGAAGSQRWEIRPGAPGGGLQSGNDLHCCVRELRVDPVVEDLFRAGATAASYKLTVGPRGMGLWELQACRLGSRLKADDMVAAGSGPSAAGPSVTSVDWAGFLARSDPVWRWRTEQPSSFAYHPSDAAFVGNGMLGLQLLADATDVDWIHGDKVWAFRFEVGRADVFDVRTAGPSARVRLPIGYLKLRTTLPPVSGSYRISLHDGLIQGQIKTGDPAAANPVGSETIDFVAFTHAERMVSVVRLETDSEIEANASLEFVARAGSAASVNDECFTFLKGPTCHVAALPANYTPNPAVECQNNTAAGSCTQNLLAGGSYSTAWRSVPLPSSTAARGVTFYQTTANDIAWAVKL